jgi:hypothetical protein
MKPLLLSLALWLPAAGFAQTCYVDWQVVAGGGDTSADATYQVSGTAGQAEAGDVLTGDGYSVVGGYWAEEMDQPAAAPMIVHRTAGLALLIALADVATNWSGPNPVTLAGLDRTTTNGVNILTNSLWILYPKSSPNVNDQISYSIGDDQGGIATGLINVVVDLSVTGTNSITKIVIGNGSSANTLTAFGMPGYNYILERATNLTPAIWVDISTNMAGTNGVIFMPDNFNDLGGIQPRSAFYRLKWQP